MTKKLNFIGRLCLVCLFLNFSFCSHKLKDSISVSDIAFLKERLTDSSQIIHEPSSWPTNRRYFFLIRTFAQMGIMRCDHFLPQKNCFVSGSRKQKKQNSQENKFNLHSEKILVQLQPNQRFDKTRPVNSPLKTTLTSQLKKEKNNYTYLYKAHNSIRNLKNIMISPASSLTLDKIESQNKLFILNYLQNETDGLARIIAALELFHYFLKRCKLKSRTFAFVEGDLALDYFLKKNKIHTRTNEGELTPAVAYFIKTGYLIMENKKMLVHSIFNQSNLDELVKITSEKKDFFCQSSSRNHN